MRLRFLGIAALVAAVAGACSTQGVTGAGTTPDDTSVSASSTTTAQTEGSAREGGSTTSSLVPTTTTTTTTAPTPQYRFPIDPAPAASYQDDHHDYPAADVFADCGTKVVSPTNGRVIHARGADKWNATEDNPAYRGGLSFAVLGVDGVRYYGSHLQQVDVAVGQEVQAGDLIGLVGRSGNAASTPCHLHFGISPTCSGTEWKVRRGAVWPQPYLDDWAAGGASSPVDEVVRWAQSDPGACEMAMADPTAELADT